MELSKAVARGVGGSPRAASAVAVTVLVGGCLAAPVSPRPAPAAPSRAALNASCARCHVDEAAEWRSSLHHRSFTDAAFQRALAVEDSAFCRDCHAPEAAVELGIGCVSCHVTETGAILAAGDGSAAPHRVERALDGDAACARCHEFRAPAPHGDGDDQYMQTTVREHARSSGAATSCAECHMPRAGARRSHAFSAVRDPAWLRARLSARAERTGEGVRVALSQAAPGHAFPTGDLFRRLEIGFEERSADGVVLARETRHLARHFERVPGQSARALVKDDRVFDEPRVVEWRHEAAPGASIRWWVDLQRVAQIGDGAPDEIEIESQVRIHEGALE